MALLPLASSIFYGIGGVEPLVIRRGDEQRRGRIATTYLVARQWMELSSVEMLRQ